MGSMHAYAAEDQGNQQQASLKVAAQGGDDQGGEDEDQPAEDPEGAAREDDSQNNADGPVVSDEQQGGAHRGQDRRGVAQELDVPPDPAPLGAQRQKGDQEFEVEIGRDGHQLQTTAAYQRLSSRAELPASSKNATGAWSSSCNASQRYSTWPFCAK